MSTVTGQGPGFKQGLGLFDSAMLVAGTMIGSGIFIVSADIARDVGASGWLLAVWILAGVMTVIGALSVSELAAMMPKAGGQYVYLREAFGSLPAFLFGWTAFTVIQTGTIAAVGVAFAKFLGVLIPELGTGEKGLLFRISDFHVVLTLPLPWLAEPLKVFERREFTIHAGQLIAVAVILGLTLWNSFGVTKGKWIQNLFGVAKIGALIALIVVGLFITANSAAIQQNTGNLWRGIENTSRTQDLSKLVPQGGALVALMVVGGAMVGALFSADAWGNVTFTAGEVRNPRRNLPLSMVLGTGLVILLYVLANVAYLATLPLDGVKSGATPTERGIAFASDDRVGTAVMEVASPSSGVTLMAIAVMVSTFGCLNGLVLMGPRLYYAMAQDRLFFASVGRLNGQGVPGWGLWLQALWACTLVFSGTYGELLDYVIFAQVLFYGLTVAGLFVLRLTRPQMERPYRAFAYPILPGLYVVMCVAIMLDLLIVKPIYTWPGLVLVIAGIPVYFLWRLFFRSPPASATRI